MIHMPPMDHELEITEYVMLNNQAPVAVSLPDGIKALRPVKSNFDGRFYGTRDINCMVNSRQQ